MPSKKNRISVDALDAAFSDLSDGAYFAAMAEQGWEPEDLIGERPYYESTPRERQCPECKKRFTGKLALRQHRRDKHNQPPAPTR